MPLRAISLAIVGAAHKNPDGSDRELEIEACTPGEPISLVPEAENKFDPHAIAVYSCRDVQIGYVSAERAPRIVALMGQLEIQAVFQRPSEFGAWARVTFDGSRPVLTPAMLFAQEAEQDASGHFGEPDFYPDDIVNYEQIVSVSAATVPVCLTAAQVDGLAIPPRDKKAKSKLLSPANS